MAKLGANVITELKPRIIVIGVGGAGCNAVNNMIATGLSGITYIAANTDAQALALSSAEQRLQLGVTLTEGLGAGSKPEIGEAAAEEAVAEIRRHVEGAHMVFIAAGMGGGTGTGAAAVIARVARESGALTVAIVSKPFHFEGTRRMRIAQQGIEQLKDQVDTLIVIPNQNLFRLATNRTTFSEAFVLADQVLYSGIACIVDLILKDGLINLDFADVRTIMSGMGTAVMGTGEASGERRATIAAEEAISNPLLEDLSLAGARGVLLSIIGGPDLTLYEVDEAASRVRQEVDPEANIIVGATFDAALGERVRVSIVATGMGGAQSAALHPDARKSGSATTPPPAPAAPSSAPYAAPVGQTRTSAPSSVASAAPPVKAAGTVPPPPPRPQAMASGATGADPYLGDTSAEDFARALSAALSEQPAAAPPRNAGPAGGREIWHGPDGVTIESGSALAPPPVNRPGSAERPTPSGASVLPQGFVPGAPEPVSRGPVRIPGVDEFPIVGQRAYYGQRDAQPPSQNHPRASAAAYEAGPTQSAMPLSVDRDTGEPRRKPNLLERITGMRMRGDSAEQGQPSYPQDGDARRAASRGTAAEHHAASAKSDRGRS